jgi:hypothetical protein
MVGVVMIHDATAVFSFFLSLMRLDNLRLRHISAGWCDLTSLSVTHSCQHSLYNT